MNSRYKCKLKKYITGKVLAISLCFIIPLGLIGNSFAEIYDVDMKEIVDKYMKMCDMFCDRAEGEDKSWANAKIVDQGITEIVFFNEEGEVSERYKGNDAEEIVEDIMKDSKYRGF